MKPKLEPVSDSTNGSRPYSQVLRNLLLRKIASICTFVTAVVKKPKLDDADVTVTRLFADKPIRGQPVRGQDNSRTRPFADQKFRGQTNSRTRRFADRSFRGQRSIILSKIEKFSNLFCCRPIGLAVLLTDITYCPTQCIFNEIN